MEYTLIRSSRKTIGLQIKRGKIIVRAPMKLSMERIEAFVQAHEAWIETHLASSVAREQQYEGLEKLSSEELRALADRACEVIPARVRHYATLLGVTYGRITVRNQKTRWGSCSAKGNLNFNCLLMLAPPPVLDSVVVHELCHRKEMNHSPRFYAEVCRVFPEYDKWHGWLRENGAVLMRRMEG